MMRLSSGFSRSMTPASLEDITLPDGARALLLVSSQAGQILAPGARARQIISGFEGTGTHVAVLDSDGRVLAASSTFDAIGLAPGDITRMIADVADESDRLVKRMSEALNGPVPTAIGRLADDPALHLLFAVEPASPDDQEAGTGEVSDAVYPRDDAQTSEAGAETPAGTDTGPEDDTDESQDAQTDTARDEGDQAGPGSMDAAPGSDDSRDETALESDAADHHGGAAVSDHEDEPEALADAGPATKAAYRPMSFDTSRIRDELNARLAKLRADEERADDVLPFADPHELDTGLTDATDNETGPETDREPDLETGPADAEEPGEMDLAAPADEPAELSRPADADEPYRPADTSGPDRPAPTGDTAPSAAEDAPAAAAPEFRFDPNSKPARFVWKINRDGKFSDVSPEFAAAVGPQSADIVGRSFPDLARVFNLDPDHVISELLNRRDTWSGKTVYWPIQGTTLVTPVDLAALPTYTRDRQFDGFRGFGIVRLGETRQDPEELGLALVPGARLRTVNTTPEEDHAEPDDTQRADTSGQPGDAGMSAEDEADLEMQNLERDIEELSLMDRAGNEPGDAPGHGADEAGSDETSETADLTEADEDPFRGERPAIRMVETPMRRDSDKIIDLEARRTRSRDGLSPGEQAAFREIGVRLNESSAAGADTADAGQSTAPDQQEDRPSFGRRQSTAQDGQPGAGDIEIDFDAGTAQEAGDSPDAAETGAGDEIPASAAGGESAIDADTHAGAPVEDLGESPSPEVEWIEPTAVEPLPSAFALPARQVMQPGLDAGLVDAIPAALLVHAGDELIHANAEFFELTGYASLGELAECGGLDHLLDRSDDETAGDGGMIVRRGDGGASRVTARLRSVNWGDGQALLLALSPIKAEFSRMDADAITPVEAEALAETSAAEPDAPGSDAPEAAPDLSAALKIEAQELRSILETATDGVVILDNDGTIRSMNGSACALFNYNESETQGQPFAMLFAHESQRAVMDYVSGLADHGVSSVLNDGREVIGREASGGFLPLFMTIGRLSGSNGFCAVLRDITQWKRTEEELRTAKRAAETANSHKSDFLARVSHEIRTPLNAIIGFSEMMVEERFGPIGSPRYLEYAHDIGNSGKHVLDIVNDLLDISKIEAGQEQMEFVAVSLNDHLAESVSLLQPMANSQRVIIRTSLSASVPEVVADRRSIKQIALNLLSNAIRFTPSGGQIVVSTSYEPTGNVVIRIRDTGIGMSRKELEQAMKPFGQVGPGPRQRGEGTGLGLPLTKAMVEANRAQFDIVSTPSEGTLVSIAFPPQRVLAD
ncbi:MAG: PAS domain S-box protein [Hoeflea sp.]|nr:PAS domain S-box protein [Hoeflea sp.]